MSYDFEPEFPKDIELEPWHCSCGASNSPGAGYCSQCGAPYEWVEPTDMLEFDEGDVVSREQAFGTPLADLVECPQCDAQFARFASRCPRCGFRCRSLRDTHIRYEPVRLPSPWLRRLMVIALWILTISGAILAAKSFL